MAPDLISPNTKLPRAGRSLLRWLLLAAVLIVGSLVAANWFHTAWKSRSGAQQDSAGLSRTLPLDPRLASLSSYRNIRPEIEYVGDQVCASCHPAETASFQHHPMGRSAAYVSRDSPTEPFDRSTQNPFEALGLEFQVGARGQGIFHKEVRRDAQHRVVGEVEADVLMAIGSGTQGRSFAINRDGYLFQSPISWFTDTHSWGLSPGFMERTIHFQRPISVQCLFCHVNQITPVEHTANRYVLPLPQHLAIGCERCHGPGQLHVQQREAGEVVTEVDDTIVNPAKLEPSLREAVCQQCHILGEERIVRRGRNLFDFRPGLPLHLFLTAFVRPTELVEAHKTVSHVEQMYLSRCFQASKAAESGEPGKTLGCISCHDPHQLPAPENRVAFYRQRCLQCHRRLVQEGSTSAPLSHHHVASDNCIGCHMPRRLTANVAHDAITDHRILRRQDSPTKQEPRFAPQPGQIPLVDFYRNLHDPGDPELGRDLALAMISLAYRQGSDEIRQVICQRALPLLEKALQTDADDIDVQEGKAYALGARGHPRTALAIFEAVLAKVPQREYSRENAARIAAELGEKEAAIGHLRLLLAGNPWNTGAHYLLAKCLGERQDWQTAIAEAEATLRLDSTHVAARTLLVAGYLQTGDKQRARKEFDLIERMRPPELDKLRRWFQDQVH
jgi:predicted CXXCH cytochrome family protein